MALLYLGMIIACLVKEIQISTELRRMGDIGLVPQELDSLILQVQAFLSILIYQLYRVKQPYHVSRLLQGYTTRRRTDWRFSYFHYYCLRKQHICTFVCTTKENYAVLQNRLYTLLCITYRPNISLPHSMSKRKHRKAYAQIHKKQQWVNLNLSSRD